MEIIPSILEGTMRHVTPEVRRLIVRARRSGMRVKDIVKIFGVSRKTVWKWMRRAKHPGRESFQGSTKNSPQG